jgi:hypothetical protein
MLIRFRCENHQSLRTEQKLSMVATRPLGDPRLVAVPSLGQSLLRAAAIYGPNAAGKSAVLGALTHVRDTVISAQALWSPEGCRREAFALDEAARAEPSEFEVDVALEGVRYRYGFALDDERVREEWLYAWPNGRRQMWFGRDAEGFTFGPALRGLQEAARACCPNGLLLNSLFVNGGEGHPRLRPLFQWFCAMAELDVTSRSTTVLYGLCSADTRAPVLQMLRQADLGIDDVTTDDGGQVLVHHESPTGGAWLPLSQAGSGAVRLVNLLLRAVGALRAGAVLLVDDLDRSLHPALFREVVALFQSPSRNPLGAQILFTAHDPSLLGQALGTSALRWDQVWMVEKAAGASSLTPLSDFHERHEDVARSYLQGRFGAVPYVAPLGFADKE